MRSIKRIRMGLMAFMVAALLLGFSQGSNEEIRIFLAGDSTMQAYKEDETPMRGWGQYLDRFFTDRVSVINRAIGGRSSGSFIREERWQGIVDQLEKGDFVFIQFGHNDGSSKPERYTSPEDYRKNLVKFVNDVRAKEANPVLLTSISMRVFEDDGKVRNGLGDYPAITREVAGELNVPMIDLNRKTAEYLETMGEEESKKLYMWLEPGQHPKYPEGLQDNTHLQEPGALLVARMAAEEINRLKIRPLVKYLKD